MRKCRATNVNIAKQQPNWRGPLFKTSKSRVRLDAAADCRREAARQFRRAINGESCVEDMASLIHALALVSRVDEGSTLEDRIAKLEEGAR